MRPHSISRGEERYNTSLTDKDITLIRQLYSERLQLLSEAKQLTDSKLAEKFNVNRSTIRKITSVVDLSDEDVRLIRELYAEKARLLSEAKKLTDKKLAEKFNVHKTTIWKITSYETWKHVPDVTPEEPNS